MYLEAEVVELVSERVAQLDNFALVAGAVEELVEAWWPVRAEGRFNHGEIRALMERRPPKRTAATSLFITTAT
jgi:hypothetical protein